jgi:hypothetical protein
MTSRAARTGRAAALLAAAGLACGGCSLLASPVTVTAPPAGGTPPASASARPSPATPGPPSPAAAPADTALPFSPARLQAAASLADRFTSAWDSWSWTIPPADWLAVLRPMAAPELYPALAQAAGTPAVLAQRKAGRQSASAVVSSAQVRDLTPGSVTVTVTVQQDIFSAAGTSQNDASFAVTLTPEGSGWLVWDIEPAGAGNS